MKKPQLSWWTTIDNSYRVFTPLLTAKPHALGPIPEDILKAQKLKMELGIKAKEFEFGGHRVQKEAESLSHPYAQEIDAYIESLGDE